MNDTHDENKKFQTNIGMMSIQEFRAMIAEDQDEWDVMFIWDEDDNDWRSIIVDVEQE